MELTHWEFCPYNKTHITNLKIKDDKDVFRQIYIYIYIYIYTVIYIYIYGNKDM